MAAESTGAAKVITRVVVYYRRAGETEERQLTIESTQGGAPIDGLSWNTPLIRKLAYRENGRYVEPRRETGQGEWRVNSSETTTPTGTEAGILSLAGTESSELSLDAPPRECIWVHSPDCTWHEYCQDG